MFLFRLYHLESFQFARMAAIVFSAFFIHYWVPFRFKEDLWVAVSIAGSFYLVGVQAATLVLSTAICIYLIFRIPLMFGGGWSSWLSSLSESLCSFCRPLRSRTLIVGPLDVIFVLRIFTYTYDQVHAKEPPPRLRVLAIFLFCPESFLIFL